MKAPVSKKSDKTSEDFFLKPMLFFLVLSNFFIVSESSAAVLGAGEAKLKSILESALSTHPKIMEQEAMVRAKEEALYGKKSQYYPSVSVTANTYDQLLGKTLLVLRQPIWSFGKIEESIRLAELELNGEATSIKKIERDVIDEVVSIYIKACGSKQKVLITYANTDEHSRILEKIKRRAIGGLATESDVRTAYSRVMQSKNQAVVQEAEYEVSLSELSELAHINVDGIEILDLGFMSLAGLDELQDKIIATTPEIEKAKDDIDNLRQKAHYIKTQSTPDVYFQVQETVNPGPGQKGVQAGLKMDYQFNGLGQVNQGQVGEAVSQAESAEERLGVQVMELTRKVRSLFINRSSVEKQIHNQRLIISNTESSMVSQLRLYDAGKKSLIEVLNMQRELSDARISLIQSQTEWILNTAKLKVMAGDFDELAGIVRE